MTLEQGAVDVLASRFQCGGETVVRVSKRLAAAQGRQGSPQTTEREEDDTG